MTIDAVDVQGVRDHPRIDMSAWVELLMFDPALAQMDESKKWI